MVREPEVARIVRIFVSSPGDVASERRALDEVVAAVNRTQASEYGIRFELQAWEKDVVPRIGPRPQTVVNDQTLEYNIYLGIMWGRFGTPTGTHGSGTEEEFRKAADNWAAVGTPWILFYFRDDPPVIRTSGDSEQYTRVLKFKEAAIARDHRHVHGSRQDRRLFREESRHPPAAAAADLPGIWRSGDDSHRPVAA